MHMYEQRKYFSTHIGTEHIRSGRLFHLRNCVNIVWSVIQNVLHICVWSFFARIHWVRQCCVEFEFEYSNTYDDERWRLLLLLWLLWCVDCKILMVYILYFHSQAACVLFVWLLLLHFTIIHLNFIYLHPQSTYCGLLFTECDINSNWYLYFILVSSVLCFRSSRIWW